MLTYSTSQTVSHEMISCYPARRDLSRTRVYERELRAATLLKMEGFGGGERPPLPAAVEAALAPSTSRDFSFATSSTGRATGPSASQLRFGAGQCTRPTCGCRSVAQNVQTGTSACRTGCLTARSLMTSPRGWVPAHALMGSHERAMGFRCGTGGRGQNYAPATPFVKEDFADVRAKPIGWSQADFAVGTRRSDIW